MVWKDVIGYEGRYKISEKGEIKSFITGKELNPGDNGSGYLFG